MPFKSRKASKPEVDGVAKDTENKSSSLCKSDSDSDEDSFLEKRAMNIQANKAMVRTKPF